MQLEWQGVDAAEEFTHTKLNKSYLNKRLNIKENGQVIKTINVRRKSKYFSTGSVTINIYSYSLITIFLIYPNSFLFL